jgi:hypothetical protein
MSLVVVFDAPAEIPRVGCIYPIPGVPIPGLPDGKLIPPSTGERGDCLQVVICCWPDEERRLGIHEITTT